MAVVAAGAVVAPIRLALTMAAVAVVKAVEEVEECTAVVAAAAEVLRHRRRPLKAVAEAEGTLRRHPYLTT